MNRKYIDIKKGEYLSDIIDEIPSNAILNKVLTGIGATHLEIKTARNSIIVEPNVPVIRGKEKSSDVKILGVREGIYTPDIKAYLLNDNIVYKKIMTTPESFPKIAEAMTHLGIDMYTDYFLLIDESDRTEADVDFRENIILPMNDFFRFKKKALVSATAVTPSDPRFERQGFTEYVVSPQFEFSKDLHLLVSNNPLYALQEHFNQSNEASLKVEEDEQIFIFINSTIGIMSIINRLKLQGKSAVFCSKDSKRKIDKKSGISVYDHIDETKFKKYNFLTSRFYSAVDIHVTQKPHVVVFTDLNLAQHTMIDPHSDLIQISGRFRNIELASLSFISSYNPAIQAMSPEEAQTTLNVHEHSYRSVKSLGEVYDEEIGKQALKEALHSLKFHSFITPQGKKNYFMLDNFRRNERIKSYYKDKDALYEALTTDELKRHFNVKYQYLPFTVGSFYPAPQGMVKYHDVVLEVANVLDNILEQNDEYTIQIGPEVQREISFQYPLIMEGYTKLGREALIEIAHTERHLKTAIKEYDEKIGIRNNFQFIDDLYSIFKVGEFYEGTYITETFLKLASKYDTPYSNSRKVIGYMQNFFSISNRTTRKGKKGRVILDKKFNG